MEKTMAGKQDMEMNIYEVPNSQNDNDNFRTVVSAGSDTGTISPWWMKFMTSAVLILMFFLFVLLIILTVGVFAALSTLNKNAGNTMADASSNYEAYSATTTAPSQEGHKDCASLKKSGNNIDGVYDIYLESNHPVKVFCDMTTDGGGWTVIQRRMNSDVDFYRSWASYQRFFGTVNGNYWFGLENISFMTLRQPQELYVRLMGHSDIFYYAKYSSFTVGPSSNMYVLSVHWDNGTAGDSLIYHNGQAFSTYDRDNDKHASANCASSYHGAWWYNSCYSSNLNGQYVTSAKVVDESMNWHRIKNKHEALKSSIMMIRPVSWSEF